MGSTHMSDNICVGAHWLPASSSWPAHSRSPHPTPHAAAATKPTADEAPPVKSWTPSSTAPCPRSARRPRRRPAAQTLLPQLRRRRRRQHQHRRPVRRHRQLQPEPPSARSTSRSASAPPPRTTPTATTATARSPPSRSRSPTTATPSPARLWFATNRGYARALDGYLKVKTEQQVRAKEEDASADFSVETTSRRPRRLLPPPPPWSSTAPPGSSACARSPASSPQFPDVFADSGQFEASNETDYFVSSEGTRVATPSHVARLVIVARTRAADGMDLFRDETFEADAAAHLPDQKTAPRKDPRHGEESRSPARRAHHRALQRPRHPQRPRLRRLLPRGPRPPPRRPAPARRRGGPDLHQAARQAHPALRSSPSPTTPPSASFQGTALSGHYDFDDEGQAARRVDLIKDGVLETFLMSRLPIASVSNSNGHGRAEARPHAHRPPGQPHRHLVQDRPRSRAPRRCSSPRPRSRASPTASTSKTSPPASRSPRAARRRPSRSSRWSSTASTSMAAPTSSSAASASSARRRPRSTASSPPATSRTSSTASAARSPAASPSAPSRPPCWSARSRPSARPRAPPVRRSCRRPPLMAKEAK